MPDIMPTVSETIPARPVFGNDVIALLPTQYRVKRYIMVVILVGFGLWFGYDGFVGFRQNARIEQLDQQIIAAREAARKPGGNEEAVKKLEFEKSRLTKTH